MIIFLESIKGTFIKKLIKNVEKVIPKAQENLSID
ncbi:hypothetical protein BD780_000832 [Clostridium tetanomorphum]|nr:hypothetical protein [Clostridium tetanomorphum]